LYIELDDAIGKVTIESLISSTIKLNSIVDRVKNATNDGQPLSVFEKYMMIYYYVTDFMYNEQNEMSEKSRNWIYVLESKEIVCVGYHELIKKICDRVFSPEEVCVAPSSATINDKEGNFSGYHKASLIYMNDPKYGIHGLMHSDACWDAVDEKGRKFINHCCIPIEDMMYGDYSIEFTSDVAKWYLRRFEDYRYKDKRADTYFNDREDDISIITREYFDSEKQVYAGDFLNFSAILPPLTSEYLSLLH